MVKQVKILQKVALIFKNKVLVLKRTGTDEVRPNCWDLPGGNVDDRDVILSARNVLSEALAREIKEETGLEVLEKDIEFVWFNKGMRNPTGELMMWLGYKVVLDSESRVKISKEHTQFSWVSSDEYFKLDFGDQIYISLGKMVL